MGKNETTRSARRGLNAVLACVVLATLPHVGQSQEPRDEDKRPLQYRVWVSAERSSCVAVRDLVNNLPNQNVSRASNAGHPAFVRWSGNAAYVDRVDSAGTKLFFPITTATVVLSPNGTSSPILRYSGSLAGAQNDSLYVLDPGTALPTDGEQLRNVLRAKQPSYSSGESIQRLREVHGNAWREWDVSGQVTISAIEIRNRTYFVAESASWRILVFSLTPEGRRQDICVLRRVCPCDSDACAARLSPRDKQRLTPDRKYCAK